MKQEIEREGVYMTSAYIDTADEHERKFKTREVRSALVCVCLLKKREREKRDKGRREREEEGEKRKREKESAYLGGCKRHNREGPSEC